MHIFLEANLFTDRLDKFLSRWKNLSTKKLLILGEKEPIGKIYFKCDKDALEIPARVKESGQVLVGAENAIKVLNMYSGIDEVEIFTKGEVLVLKQRNFTMSLPCVTDDNLEQFGEALATDRLSMLKMERRRLKEEVRRIEQEIASMSGATRIRKRRL